MRNIIYAINITADGCCDHTKGMADAELHDYYTALLSEVDLLVFGRVTYELMVPYWPDVARNHSSTRSENDFADAFDSKNKLVFSRTLLSQSLMSADDKKTRIVRDNLKEEILKLKSEHGKDILVGGVSIPSQLIELGLVDEYRFVVQPIIAGEGRRLSDIHLTESSHLRLVDSKIFQSGCIANRYVKQ
jgi:dihydrofolate reductase